MDEAMPERRMKYVNRCVKKFMDWMETEGKAKGLQAGSRAFVEWDETQNDRKLFEWDDARSAIRGRLAEAAASLSEAEQVK